MNVFELRERLIGDYSSYIRSFIRIRDQRIDGLVAACLDAGVLWPDPLIQLNPSFRFACTIDGLVADGTMHPDCAAIFRVGKDAGTGKRLRLYQHQADAIQRACSGRNDVLTTGTGSGKNVAYIVPIVDHILRNGGGRCHETNLRYDAVAEADRTGVPYQTRLDPPPTEPRVAHPPQGGTQSA